MKQRARFVTRGGDLIRDFGSLNQTDGCICNRKCRRRLTVTLSPVNGQLTGGDLGAVNKTS